MEKVLQAVYKAHTIQLSVHGHGEALFFGGAISGEDAQIHEEGLCKGGCAFRSLYNFHRL
jgi:hypothetical protein